MSLSEQIIAALRARNASGETYKSMHQSSGITQSYIHGIVNRKYDPLKMSLFTFAALFPRAAIYLEGADVASEAAAVDLSEYVPRSDYAALRDQYQDLRDRYQDLREQYIDLKERAAESPRNERPRVPRNERPARPSQRTPARPSQRTPARPSQRTPPRPYRVEPAPSTLSHLNK